MGERLIENIQTKTHKEQKNRIEKKESRRDTEHWENFCQTYSYSPESSQENGAQLVFDNIIPNYCQNC